MYYYKCSNFKVLYSCTRTSMTRRSVPVQNLNRLPVPAKRIVLIQNFLRTTEHVSDLLGRLWFMRPSFEKFADASRLLALPWYFDSKLTYNLFPHSDSSYKFGGYIRVRVVQNIVHDVDKSEKFYSGEPPQIKNRERSAKGHRNPG